MALDLARAAMEDFRLIAADGQDHRPHPHLGIRRQDALAHLVGAGGGCFGGRRIVPFQMRQFRGGIERSRLDDEVVRPVIQDLARSSRIYRGARLGNQSKVGCLLPPCE